PYLELFQTIFAGAIWLTIPISQHRLGPYFFLLVILFSRGNLLPRLSLLGRGKGYYGLNPRLCQHLFLNYFFALKNPAIADYWRGL
ncbi:MAG: hypothetical protein FWC78_00450, partial [Defluviitaleaceae bacterium]|nr:hypothetical protein [Defluviitaleaceae bacterium]